MCRQYSYDREKLQEYVDTKKQIETLKGTLENDKASLEKMNQELNVKKETLTTTIQAKQAEEKQVLAAAQAVARKRQAEGKVEQAEPPAKNETTPVQPGDLQVRHTFCGAGDTDGTRDASRARDTDGTRDASRARDTDGTADASRTGDTDGTADTSRTGSTDGTTDTKRTGSTDGTAGASRAGSTDGITDTSRTGALTEPQTPVEPEAPTEPQTPVEPETPTEPQAPVEPQTPVEPEGNQSVAQQIVSAAYSSGIPYVWGGTTTAGFDCSGMVQAAHAAAGISIPRVSCNQGAAGVQVSAEELLGDIVYYGWHVGMAHREWTDDPCTGRRGCCKNFNSRLGQRIHLYAAGRQVH